MESVIQPKIKFDGINIVNVQVNVMQPSQEEEAQNVELNLDARLFPLEEGSREFRIWMEVEVQVRDFWLVKVAGFGLFELSEDLTAEEMRSLINVNAPAIMFPYFRAFISTLTANCGGSLPSVMLPPRTFVGEMEEVKLEKSVSKE